MADQKTVNELWEKVKNRPGLNQALAELEKIGLLRPVVIVPTPRS